MDRIELVNYLPLRFSTWVDFYLYLKEETHDFMEADRLTGKVVKMKEVLFASFDNHITLGVHIDLMPEGTVFVQKFNVGEIERNAFNEMLQERDEFSYYDWSTILMSLLKNGTGNTQLIDTINKKVIESGSKLNHYM